MFCVCVSLQVSTVHIFDLNTRLLYTSIRLDAIMAASFALTTFAFPFRWAIRVISGEREITIALVSVSTTIVSRLDPMMGKGNKTRAPRKRRPIPRPSLARRGKDPVEFPSGALADFHTSQTIQTYLSPKRSQFRKTLHWNFSKTYVHRRR